jgi:hypothetical protein
MGRRRTHRGRRTPRDSPDWKPLPEVVGEEVTGDFLWMFEI